MADLMDLSVTISTPTTPLELNDHTAFELVEWNPPIQQVELVMRSGPYQSGAIAVSGRRSEGVIAATVRVLGASWEAQQANVASLISALSQWSYEVTESINDQARVFPAMPANVTLANGLDGFQVYRARHEYVLQIPVNPPTIVEGS